MDISNFNNLAPHSVVESNSSSSCGNNTCDRMKYKLSEAQKTISNQDQIIKMLRCQVEKMENNYKNNLKKTEEYRFKYCQAKEKCDINELNNNIPKEASQENEIKSIKKELCNWKSQCEILLNDKNINPEITCKLMHQNIENVIKDHYDMLKVLITKIADKKPFHNKEDFYANNLKNDVVDKLFQLNEKIDELFEKEDHTYQELQSIKQHLIMFKAKNEDCVGGITQVHSDIKLSKDSAMSKLSELESLAQKSLEIQQQLSEIKENITDILLNAQLSDDKSKSNLREDIDLTKVEKLFSEIEQSAEMLAQTKSSTNTVYDVCKNNYPNDNQAEKPGTDLITKDEQQIAPDFTMLQEHYEDLTREKEEKDQHIQWLNELINHYNNLNNEINKMPTTDLKQFDKEDEIYRDINQISQEKIRLKNKISSVMDTLQNKISSLNTSTSQQSTNPDLADASIMGDQPYRDRNLLLTSGCQDNLTKKNNFMDRKPYGMNWQKYKHPGRENVNFNHYQTKHYKIEGAPRKIKRAKRDNHRSRLQSLKEIEAFKRKGNVAPTRTTIKIERNGDPIYPTYPYPLPKRFNIAKKYYFEDVETLEATNIQYFKHKGQEHHKYDTDESEDEIATIDLNSQSKLASCFVSKTFIKKKNTLPPGYYPINEDDKSQIISNRCAIAKSSQETFSSFTDSVETDTRYNLVENQDFIDTYQKKEPQPFSHFNQQACRGDKQMRDNIKLQETQQRNFFANNIDTCRSYGHVAKISKNQHRKPVISYNSGHLYDVDETWSTTQRKPSQQNNYESNHIKSASGYLRNPLKMTEIPCTPQNYNENYYADYEKQETVFANCVRDTCGSFHYSTANIESCDKCRQQVPTHTTQSQQLKFNKIQKWDNDELQETQPTHFLSNCLDNCGFYDNGANLAKKQRKQLQSFPFNTGHFSELDTWSKQHVSNIYSVSNHEQNRHVVHDSPDNETYKHNNETNQIKSASGYIRRPCRMMEFSSNEKDCHENYYNNYNEQERCNTCRHNHQQAIKSTESNFMHQRKESFSNSELNEEYQNMYVLEKCSKCTYDIQTTAECDTFKQKHQQLNQTKSTQSKLLDHNKDFPQRFEQKEESPCYATTINNITCNTCRQKRQQTNEINGEENWDVFNSKEKLDNTPNYVKDNCNNYHNLAPIEHFITCDKCKQSIQQNKQISVEKDLTEINEKNVLLSRGYKCNVYPTCHACGNKNHQSLMNSESFLKMNEIESKLPECSKCNSTQTSDNVESKVNDEKTDLSSCYIPESTTRTDQNTQERSIDKTQETVNSNSKQKCDEVDLKENFKNPALLNGTCNCVETELVNNSETKSYQANQQINQSSPPILDSQFKSPECNKVYNDPKNQLTNQLESATNDSQLKSPECTKYAEKESCNNFDKSAGTPMQLSHSIGPNPIKDRGPPPPYEDNTSDQKPKEQQENSLVPKQMEGDGPKIRFEAFKIDKELTCFADYPLCTQTLYNRNPISKEKRKPYSCDSSGVCEILKKQTCLIPGLKTSFKQSSNVNYKGHHKKRSCDYGVVKKFNPLKILSRKSISEFNKSFSMKESIPKITISGEVTVDKDKGYGNLEIEDIFQSVLLSRKPSSIAKPNENTTAAPALPSTVTDKPICDTISKSSLSPKTGEEESLLTNLENYKYYLQQQLDIITSIEDEMDELEI